ncbi:unnamed protein product [Acanthocheilonema viteae]|uniref:Neurotransmitter-gated ion-channel ligand-binding domain-containing protein n=1 Tax=Acanthocheilonema viteae TaxID=6277 RepID=A0A498S8Q6_ACAVI|nr:unnamed protein product [Acanthocheilonema viteae]
MSAFSKRRTLGLSRYPVTLTITFLLSLSVLFVQTNVAIKLPDIPDREEMSDVELKQHGMNDEQRLFKHIVRNYDISVRPVWNASTVDERNQVLTLNVWVEQSWRDERIRWDPIEFGNISKLTVGKKYLWTPDIVLYNNARDFSRGFVDTNLHILSNGDRIYDQSQLDVQIMERYDGKNPFTRDSFIENGEWEIVANRTRKILRGRQTTFSTIVFELHLRRRVLYFIYNIIAPCFMLSMLTMMQFLLPCESGEKITLGLTVLLAYSVFSFNIAENMPETSEVIPLIAIYLMGIMTISGLGVCLSVIVLNMRHSAERNCRPPYWLNFIAYRILGRLFGTATPKTRRKLEYAKNTKDLMSEIIIERIENENDHDELVEEWNHISIVFDRFFFCCIFFLTGIATFFLLIAPRFSHRDFDMNL